MTVSISNMAQVWMSNTNTYNGIAMSISTMGYGANSNSSLLNFSVDGNTKFRVDSNGSIITSGSFSTNGHFLPASSNTYDLGSSTARWRNLYTGDLHLVNEYGNWTIVEGEDNLFFYNNKKGKVYTLNLVEVNPDSAPPKKSS